MRSAPSSRYPAKNAASDTAYEYHVRFFMTTAYRQPTELGVHCPWCRFYAKPFRGGRRRAKSSSMDFATGRRPGFDWANPLVRAHACHWESLNISFRTATVSKSGIRKGRRTAASAPAIQHKVESVAAGAASGVGSVSRAASAAAAACLTSVRRTARSACASTSDSKSFAASSIIGSIPRVGTAGGAGSVTRRATRRVASPADARRRRTNGAVAAASASARC